MDNYQEDENQPLVQNREPVKDFKPVQKHEQILTINDKRKRQAVKLISRQQKSQINQDKQRAIQGFIVVLITLLFLFSGLLLLHIHDKEHTKLKKFNFIETESHVEIIKPELDKNDYKYYKMKNGIQVLLVSDPQAWMATAALDVKTGSLNNPEEFQGLAHFLEHMVFLQSNMSNIDEYLGKNGGFSNAYTSGINTNYYMDCYGYALEDGLQLFSKMFYDFEIEQEALEKEISAVNGEHEINISSDSWKIQNLISLISREDHPESLFSTGNRDSLIKDGIKEALETYFNDHYSANLMTLVVTSYQPIEEIEEMVKNADFNKIENKNLEVTTYQKDPISDDYTGGLIKLNWESESTQLVILSQLDELSKQKFSKDLQFIFHSLFNLDKDSLIDILKSQELIEDVGHGFLSDTNDYGLYATVFQLTSKGEEDYDKIINLYYTSLQKLIDEGIDQEIYEEQKELSKIDFRFMNFSGDSTDLASDLACDLNEVGPEYVLFSDYFYPDFNEENIISIIEQLKDSSKSVYILEKNYESQAQQEESEQEQLEEASSSFVSLQKKKHIKNKEQNKSKKHENIVSKKQKSTEKHTEHQQKQQNAKNSAKQQPHTKQEKQHKSQSKQKTQSKKQQNNSKATGKITQNNEKQNKTKKQQKQNPKIVNGLNSKQLSFTLSKDHKNFLAQNSLTNVSELLNIKWDFETISEEEHTEVNELNVDLYDKIMLATSNKFIPKDLSLISLCEDTESSAMDIGYQLNSLLNDSNNNDESTTDDDERNDYDQQLLEIIEDLDDLDGGNLLNDSELFSSGTKRYHQFMFKSFDATKYSSLEQCQKKEVQYEKAKKYPQLLTEDVRGKLFYQLDRSFKTPKNIVMTSFTSNQLPINAKTTVSLTLLNYSLQNKIEKEFAKQIEVGYEIYATTSQQGLSIYVEGWSEHFSEVAAKAFATLSDLTITNKEIRQAKEVFQAQLADQKTLNPLDQALRVKLPLLLQKPYVSTESMVKAIDEMELENVNNLKKELLSQVKLNTLVFGNISEQETKMLYETVTNLFPGAQNEIRDSYQVNKISNIEDKNLLVREFTAGPEDELNSATVNYYQVGERTLESQITMDLIDELAFSFFYTYLRTDRELGYTVSAMPSPFACVDGYSLLVLGSKEAPHVVDNIIGDSLKEFYQELKKVSADEYSEMQGSSYQSYDIEFTEMYDKASYYFSFIQSGDYFFDLLQQKQVYIEKVSKKDVLKFYKKTFLEKPGKLSVQIYSKTGNVEYPEDLQEQQQSQEVAQNSTEFTQVDNNNNEKVYEFVVDNNQLHTKQDYTCSYKNSYE